MSRTTQKKAKPIKPTAETYRTLECAYAFFNKRLFKGKLPHCLITLQRKPRTKGFFVGDRFVARARGIETTSVVADEIALNPSTFADRTDREILSTLVHEMVHLWQHHFGEPPRRAYHNREWATKMREVGLIPTDTGQPGGKETGAKVTHYIQADGAYDHAFTEWREHKDYRPLLVEAWRDEKTAKRKAASKTKYTCGGCGTNAWAKPDVSLLCGDCEELLVRGDASRSVKVGSQLGALLGLEPVGA